MPHPDDEAVFLSGTIRQLVKHKINVKVVTMTRGEASTLRYGLKDGDDLAESREVELTSVFKILGVTEFEILQFKDGSLAQQSNKLESTISKILESFKPKIAITLEPDGVYGHPDHIALSEAVKSTIKPPCQLVYATVAENEVKPKASAMAVREVNPLKPNIIVRLGALDKITKIRSIKAHKTQFNFKNSPPEDYNFFKDNKLLDFEYLAQTRTT